MKIYLKQSKQQVSVLSDQPEYIDVRFLSFLKAHFFSTLFWGLIIYIITTIIVNIAQTI